MIETGASVLDEHYFPHVDRWLRINAFPRGGDRFAVLFGDVTARRRAEESLRESEERQAFLLALSDALRPLDAPAEIQGEATRLLREHLAAGWCYYVEWDEAAERGVVLRDATREGLPSLVGSHDVSDAPAFLPLLRTGNVLNVRDYASFDGLSPDLRARYTAMGFRSMLMATLVKQGRLVASLLVGDTEMRDWSSDAEALLMDVAERTWAAVERARAEAALRVSEVRYRTIFESIDEGFAVAEVLYDAEGRPVDLLYLEANPAASRLTGGTVFAGRRASEVLPEADRTSLQIYDSVARTGKAERVERYYASFDRWYEGHISPVIDVERGGTNTIPRRVAIVFRDMTEARRVVEALRESEEKYRSLFESIDEGFAIQEVVTDENGNVTDVTYLEVNEAFEQISGMKNIPGKKASELLPRLEQHWLDTQTHIYKTGKPLRGENYSADIGKWITYHFSRIGGAGSPLIGVVFNDVTERKRRERQQEFLLKFADALRPLLDPTEIQIEAARVIGRHLGAGRAAYAEVEGDDAHFVVHRDYTNGVPSFAGRYPLEGFGSRFFADLRIGRTVTVTDAECDAHLSGADQANFAATAVRAAVAVPLIKGGRLAAVFFLHFPAPREWRTDEVALVEETAERTWAAVERARAEAALRESEEQFRRAVEEAPIPVIMHAEDGQVLQISRTWTELTGFRHEDMPTFEAWLNHAYGEGADAVRNHMQALFAGTRHAVGIEFPVRTRTGEGRHWSFSASSPGTLGDGRRFIVGMAVDITERKLAEAALRASEERLRTLMEGIPQLVWRSRGAGEWTWASPQWLGFTGQGQEESHGRGWLAAVHPDDRERTIVAWERASAEGGLDVEHRVRRATDGAYVWHHTRSLPLRDEAGHAVEWLGTSTDIEGLKRAEAALRESQAQLAGQLEDIEQIQRASSRLIEDGEDETLFAALLEAAMAVVGAECGSIQMLNREGKLDLIASRNFHPASAEFWRTVTVESSSSCGAALQHGERVIVPDTRAAETLRGTEDLRHYLQSGILAVQSTPLITREGQLIGLISTHWHAVHTPNERELGLLDILAREAADFFDRRRAQAALRESEERFRLLVDNVQEYALFQTDPEGRVTSWNPGAERLFGYSSAEMLGQDVSRLLTPEDEQARVLDREIARVMQGNREQDARWLVRKDGSRFWAQWITEPVHDETGAIRGVVKVLRDETDRQRADQAIRASLAEQEQLLKEVHHRVKNNLQVITSLINLQARQVQDERALALFDETRNRVYSIAAIHELIYRSASFAAIQLADYARQLVPDLVRFYGMEDRISVTIAGDGATLELERAVPYGLLLNELVSNACKHAFPDSVRGALSVAVTVEPAGEYASLEVADNGVGLPEDFDYRRASTLGMQLVHSLARQLRATVSVLPGPGTRVRVRIPQRRPEEAR